LLFQLHLARDFSHKELCVELLHVLI